MNDIQYRDDLLTSYKIGIDVAKNNTKCKIKSQKGTKITKDIYDLKSYQWSYSSQREILKSFLDGQKDYLRLTVDCLNELIRAAKI